MTWHPRIGSELAKRTGLASTESGTTCDGCGRFERARRADGMLKTWALYGTTPNGWREVKTPGKSRHYCTRCKEAQ